MTNTLMYSISYPSDIDCNIHRNRIKPGYLGRQRIVRLGKPKYTPDEDREISRMHREHMEHQRQLELKRENDTMEEITMEDELDGVDSQDICSFDPLGFIRDFFKYDSKGNPRHIFA